MMKVLINENIMNIYKDCDSKIIEIDIPEETIYLSANGTVEVSLLFIFVPSLRQVVVFHTFLNSVH